MPCRPRGGHSKDNSIGSSVSGEGDHDKKRKIHQWIDDIDSIENVTSRSSLAGTELGSVISSEDSPAGRSLTLRGSASDTTHPSTAFSGSILDDDEPDSEDDFIVEAAQQALGKGKDTFNQDDYSGASAYLAEALTMIKGLSHKQQSSCDTWELRRMLGVCAFHTTSPLEAEAALLSVLDNAPKNAILNEQQRLHVSETAHLLAQTYIKLAQLEKAYRYCEYALRGRRRVLGKSHHQSYESLALMARILQLQDNNLRAEFFIVMIPESVRETYVNRYAGLCLPEDPPQIDDPRPIAPVITPATPIEQSLQLTMDEVAGAPPEIPERRRPRPVSVFPGEFGTFLNISPPESPEKVRKPIFNPSPDSNGLVRPAFGQVRSLTEQPVPTQQEAIQDRSSYPRSTSDAPNTFTDDDVFSDNGRRQESVSLMPLPLRLQRPALVSELPGDSTFFPVLNGAQAPPTPPSSLPSAEEKVVSFTPSLDPPIQLLQPDNRHSISVDRPYTPSVYSQATVEVPPRTSMASTVERMSSDILSRRKSSSTFLRMFKTTSSGSENSANEDSFLFPNTVRLSRKDYDSIKGDVLTDNAIDFWQEHLEHTMVKYNSKFTLLRPLRAQLLQGPSDPATLKSAALPDISGALHAFVPLKSSSNHWSLLLVSSADGVACHYDPYKSRNKKLASQVTTRISNHISKQLTFLDVLDLPETSNDKDSGVYICVFIRELINKLMETDVSQKFHSKLTMKAIDVKAERKKMVKVVEENMKTREKVKSPSASSSLSRAFAYPYVGNFTTVTAGLENRKKG